MELRLALIGFGNVGQGLAQILRDHPLPCPIRLVAVCDMQKGSLCDPGGLDPAALLSAVERTGRLDAVEAPHRGWDSLETIHKSGANVLVELGYTDLRTGEPARTHLRAALEQGLHAVTSNKGPVALHLQELGELARAKGLHLGIEGTVMSGTPCLRLGRELLAAAGITAIQGILNGTTNFILTRMEEGATYPEALAEAQTLGYAEADPTGDVEGYDAAGKAVILSRLFFGRACDMASVTRMGITALTPEDVAQARQAQERWKLVATVDATGISVGPRRLPLAHPLAGVPGATNAITFRTELLGDVTLTGPGAGRLQTGYAILADLLAIARLTEWPGFAWPLRGEHEGDAEGAKRPGGPPRSRKERP